MSRFLQRCALGLLAALCASCSGATALDDAGATGAEHSEGPSEEQLSRFIDAVEANLFELGSGGATEGQLATQLQRVLEEDALPASLEAIDSAHLNALRPLYQERSYRPVFVEQQHLNHRGLATAETLLKAHQHGLNAADFHGPALSVALLRMREREPETDGGTGALNEAQRRRLATWAGEQVGSDGTLPNAADIAESIATGGEHSPLPELSASLQRHDDAAASGPLLAALEAELLLADGWMRWARTLRYDNKAYISEEIAQARRWQLVERDPAEDEDDEDGEQDLPEPLLDLTTEEGMDEAARTLAAEHLARALLSDDFQAALEDLNPPFAQYERLLAGAAQYREFVYNGGWQELDISVPLEAGDSGQAVIALRERLADEGYFEGDLTNPTFDEALEEAVESYQEHHQIRATGEIDEGTLASLNTSAIERLAQIEVTLQRWRENRVGADHEGDYVHVNVPDFHGELWDGDELVHRWRVIVGALRRQRQDDGEMRYWGATRLFSDTMQYVVFNPYWNVPGNIWRNEYQPLMDENPNWLEENGYEILTNEHGRQFLRQLPGPQNALGLVKFLFPNEWDIYLHDTNRPRLFDYDIRAFSHGCIRSDNALELAAILLARDQDTSVNSMRYRINELLTEGSEQWISLRNPLPVHLEYYVVRGDEDGTMQFLADVYRLDRELVAAQVEELEAEFEALRAEDDALRSVQPGQPRVEL